MADRVHIRVRAGSQLIRPNLQSLEDIVRPIIVAKEFEIWADPIWDDEGVMYEFEYRGMVYSVVGESVDVLESWLEQMIRWLKRRFF